MKQLSARAAIAAAAILLALTAAPVAPLGAQTDLDAFMKDVIVRRDDNWKKLQQYILNEREQIEFRGPGQLPIWGERREYQWYLRDGFFVRSPLKVNGVSVAEADRRKYEERFIKHEQQRDKRARERAKDSGTAAAGDQAPASVDTLITQTREPQFISSAYFLKFKFEEGKYALVGKEQLDGKSVLKVEYYPARLFSDDTDRNKRRTERGEKLSRDQQNDQTIEQAINKVSKVTLWIEPTQHQIVKYIFENVNFDFLPGAWLVRLGDLNATMVMSQPFASIENPTKDMLASKDVWLPRNIELYAQLLIAIGQFDVKYSINYADYRLAETSSRIK